MGFSFGQLTRVKSPLYTIGAVTKKPMHLWKAWQHAYLEILKNKHKIRVCCVEGDGTYGFELIGEGPVPYVNKNPNLRV